jgi:copper(I)-binding protein
MESILIVMRRMILPLIGAAILSGCTHPDPVVARVLAERVGAGDLVVSRPFGLVPFRDAPLPVYLHIANTGDRPDTLRGVTGGGGLPAPMVHGASMMVESTLVIPAGGELRMEPGGRHLMFNPPLPALARGDSVTLTLQFAHAGAVTVTAWILEYAEADLVR